MMEELLETTPTQHRIAKRDVTKLTEPVVVVDDDGIAVERTMPYRSNDVVARLAEEGAIDEDGEAAARRLQRAFLQAQLEPLRAADLSRPIVSGRSHAEIAFKTERARDEVYKVKLAVGEPFGTCLWDIIGCQTSLTEWAIVYSRRVGRKVRRETAREFLIIAIENLTRYFEKNPFRYD